MSDYHSAMHGNITPHPLIVASGVLFAFRIALVLIAVLWADLQTRIAAKHN